MADNPFNNSSNDLNGNGVVGGEYLQDNTTVEQQKIQFPQKLDATQNDPRTIKSIDFKQDYTVLVRKKKYYAVNQYDDELYIKVYQIDNFINVTTSNRVNGPGTCKIQIKGGERVVAADKAKIRATDWGSFEDIKKSWSNIDNEGASNGVKWSTIDGVEYRDLIKARQAKYYWKYAEKCDWEPMDEVYVFSKSKVARNGSSKDDQYSFIQIFFGYITTVSKNYASNGSLSINIDVEDHLKILRISRMFTRPPFDMSVAGVGVRYDGFGQMIVEDDAKELINPFQNFFAGAEPQEIIRQCVLGAGIPEKYLASRIEAVRRVPFVPQLQGGNYAELFRADWKTRLAFCQEAADKLNLEFFADESGNIVLKIPSYAVGINRQKANYEGNPGTTLNIQYANTSNAEEIMGQLKGSPGSDGNYTITYKVQQGDSLQKIAQMFYGNVNRASEIWNLNVSQGTLKHADTGIIEPGEEIYLKIAPAEVDGAVDGYREMKRQEYSSSQPLSTINNDSLSAKNDYLIRVINPEEIISFTVSDSDVDIYTAAQVTVEYTLLDSSMKQLPPAVTRAVQDFDLIRQFGFRLAPAINTPICGGPTGAAMYAGMIILRSISGRFTGNITMIEESSIRVGDPIRFHSYDEYPHTEMVDSDATNNPAQSVYYVESISRNITPSGVSTMTLSLKAGRNFAQPSIYDNCSELYRALYDNVVDNTTISNPAKDAEQEQKASQLQKDAQDTATQTYVVQIGDSLSAIANNFYGDSGLWQTIFNANTDQISNPDQILPGMKLKIPPQ